ncbi:cation-translocating P-type ATPase [Candidatus Nanohalovita haloferacivicina]|uniref:cation-translocating P-type ATPase n=1 Tax=Candidatus Nanohalovita haloferacivicina TaxID=2978046 RepID=UPI00325F9C0E|nr:Cation-transporting P-type ATPase [Candidatus Nanohalobia archaeon BNXNv]
MSDKKWHSKKLDKVLGELGAEKEGLSSSQADERLEKYGKNSIENENSISPVRIFLSQFQDVLVYMLFAAAAVSIGVGILPGEQARITEAGLIVFILVLNGFFGFFQDYRAEKSIKALKEMSNPDTMVLRDGEKREIDSKKVVPGDIIFLEPGTSIPADARLIEAESLSTNESALTGESSEANKSVEVLEEDTPIAETSNMVFKNTNVVNGSGKAVVVGTGMKTEVGGIAEQLNEAEDRLTPFQREVNQLGKRLGYVILGVIGLVTVFQFIFTSAAPLTIFLAALSLAVAANPVGLPAAVTLALAMGSRKMLERNVLVRRLNVIESLGSVDVIITDKTGTLTEEKMTVKKLFFKGETFKASVEDNEKPLFHRHSHETDIDHLRPLIQCGFECNDAEKAPEDEDSKYYGDPTEVALLQTARDAGLSNRSSREKTIPFNSERKRMTVVTENGEAYMKGAPEVVLERCDRILTENGVEELTEDVRETVREKNSEFSSDAMRTLGFAKKQDVESEEAEEIENQMIFLGLQGMIDPPRKEVPEAVQDCRNAGIQVVMATGDDITTAKAIGEETGFNPELSLESSQLQSLEKEEIVDKEIFARVTPEDKVKILKAHQENGSNVAMTGNGVNDAPALKNADIGVAMGERGTDVAQQSSDMIVQDDNFVSIRDAIAEGRGISDNIRKSVNYLLSGNMGEVMIVFFGLIIGGLLFPEVFQSHEEALILTPMMLLWINFISDGFPALALSTDPPMEKIMQETEKYGNKSLMDSSVLKSILYIGALMAAAGLPVFFLALGKNLLIAQTALFSFIILAETARVQVIRNRYGHSILSNNWVLAALGTSLTLQMLLLYTPAAEVFGTASLAANAWLKILAATAGFSVLTAIFSRYNQ